MKRIFKTTIPPALIAMIVMVVFLFAACAPATVVDAEGSDDGSGVLLPSKDDVAALTASVT